MFIKFGWHDTTEFYKMTCSLHDAYGSQIYARDFPPSTDITTIKKMDSTFGRLARFALFGDPKLCS